MQKENIDYNMSLVYIVYSVKIKVFDTFSDAVSEAFYNVLKGYKETSIRVFEVNGNYLYSYKDFYKKGKTIRCAVFTEDYLQ